MLLSIINIIYYFVLLVFTILYIAGTPLLLIIFKVLKGSRIDDLFRFINQTYGYYMIKAFFPFIRISITGKENIIHNKCYIIVYNHFSELDVAFSSLVPIKNQMILARNWVFNLMPFGFYMRMAGYINIDKTDFKHLSRKSEKCFKKNISLQIYPEGHRSQNGNLRRFRKGAFLLSRKFDIPVLPVCMYNTNNFLSACFPFFNSVKIKIKILKPVYPDVFNDEKELRNFVKRFQLRLAYEDAGQDRWQFGTKPVDLSDLVPHALHRQDQSA